MKRLTIEESQNYISERENVLDEEYSFYSIIPDEDNWDNVVYYVNKRKDIYNTYEGEGQWVYVLSNTSMPGILKVGYTKLNPLERVKQLSNATGVATPFNLEYCFKCFNGEALEQELHIGLDEYRVNQKREFFKVSLDTVKENILELGSKYKA